MGPPPLEIGTGAAEAEKEVRRSVERVDAGDEFRAVMVFRLMLPGTGASRTEPKPPASTIVD